MYMNTAEVPNKSNAVGLGIDKLLGQFKFVFIALIILLFYFT